MKDDWTKRHPTYSRKYAKIAYKALRNEVVKILGGKCMRCGFSDSRALQIDHINGGGRQEVIVFKNVRTTYYKTIIHMEEKKRAAKYQLLCANCNTIKKVENNEMGGRPRF